MPRAPDQSPPAPPRLPRDGLRAKVHEIIFEADTPAGKAFDVALLWAVIISVLAVMLESVAAVRAEHGRMLMGIEWFFTVLFTVEYAVRLASVQRPLRYAFSFFGLVDLVAILPTYLSVLVPGAQTFLVIRVLRLLRVFRVLKLVSFLGEAEVLLAALRASRPKITVFLLGVLSTVVIMGSIMYVVEGPAAGFDSIPRSMYWAIVTLTTVGFGDITPTTPLGQFIASILMTTGYGMIAVPTGIVSVELASATRHAHDVRACPGCGAQGHDLDALWCKLCGVEL